MTTTKAYQEVIDFIASGTSPESVVAFRPSEAAQERVRTLLHKEKNAELSDEEKAEFDHYMHIEHLMRLAKVRARQLLAT